MICGGPQPQLKVPPELWSATGFSREETTCGQPRTPDRADDHQPGSSSALGPRAKQADRLPFRQDLVCCRVAAAGLSRVVWQSLDNHDLNQCRAVAVAPRLLIKG